MGIAQYHSAFLTRAFVECITSLGDAGVETILQTQPDLVIYLQAPAEILKQRITDRGIDFEQTITTDYLAALAEAYTEFFYYYDGAPLLIVNAAEIDFANNHHHFEALLDQIFQMDGTRQFFNPNPMLL